MIGYETLLILLITGFASLVISLFLIFTGKKIKSEERIKLQSFEVKVFNSQLKLVPFIYFMIALIMFVIGLFSDFIINSSIGFIIALIPFLAYLIFDYRKNGIARKK